RTTYTGLMETLRAIEDWEQNDAVGASIAIVAHTACHLGAIRQGIGAIGRSDDQEHVPPRGSLTCRMTA
ncbi:MAG: hypothetical protein WBC63_00315, partial [Candidatus Bipolaricaulia bacterium]